MPESPLVNLTREHVLKAIADLDAGAAHPFGAPAGDILIYNGKKYAPRAVVALACRDLIGRTLQPDEISDGTAPGQATYVLRNLDFFVRYEPPEPTPEETEPAEDNSIPVPSSLSPDDEPWPPGIARGDAQNNDEARYFASREELCSEPGEVEIDQEDLFQQSDTVPDHARADRCFYAAWGVILLLGVAKFLSPPGAPFRSFLLGLILAGPVIGALFGLSLGYRRGRKLHRATAGLLLGGTCSVFLLRFIHDILKAFGVV